MDKVARYRKKPVAVAAMQWDGTDSSMEAILRWTKIVDKKGLVHWSISREGGQVLKAFVVTPNGSVQIEPNEWIIKGVDDEFYPCKPDIFQKTYDPVGVW